MSMRVMPEPHNHISGHSRLTLVVIHCTAKEDRFEMVREKGKRDCSLNSRRNCTGDSVTHANFEYRVGQ
ncbi:hypothetical protein B7P43_G04025 [Cryptotermes secundus]|uniref:Uncharacterized protein n=1 Tax=Cryptotermes secundus TaxID=105785 RepID=A0A2J7RCI2_9NEOP|nr:hypothetical protein B7P43_G04025 [Cryptotermes secundus]